MAKKVVINNISKQLNNVKKVIEKVTKEDIKRIAEKGVQVAKDTLLLSVLDEDFTQKHEYSLVDEIGLKQNSSSRFTIVAPMSDDPEIVYEMYYAEYGAGIGADNRKQKSVIRKSGYVRTGGNALAKFGVDLNGYWFYPLIGKEWVENKTDKKGRPRTKTHGRWGYTNTSEPANYMYEARKAVQKEFKALGDKVNQRIKTNIKRNK